MNSFKKLAFGFVALIIVCSLVFSTSAFKNSTSKTYSYWRYDLNQEAGALSGFNYTKINEPGAPSCDDANEIPCVIRVDETITTQNDLDDFLSNHYNSDEEVMELAIYTKSEL
jgi:hypothetical protein